MLPVISYNYDNNVDIIMNVNNTIMEITSIIIIFQIKVKKKQIVITIIQTAKIILSGWLYCLPYAMKIKNNLVISILKLNNK